MASVAATDQLSTPSTSRPGHDKALIGGDLLSIQYLRALAAIGVLIFHAADRTGSRFAMGGAGVDVFFVISGLIMWVISCRRPVSPQTFLLKRAVRIVPLYWMVTLGLVAAWWISPGLFPHMQPTAAHVVKSLLFIPHRDALGAIAPLVVPGWTLTYEVFFYLIFAVTLLAPVGLRPWALTGVIGSLVLVGALLQPQAAVPSTYTNPLMLEFLAGVWIGALWTGGRSLPPRLSAMVLAAGFALLAVVAVSGVDVERLRIVFWGAPAVLIVAGVMGLERARWVPRWGPIRFLGDASYSIYLVHGLAISVAIRVAGSAHLGPTTPTFLFAVAAGLAAGVGCHLLIERPLLRLMQPKTRGAG